MNNNDFDYLEIETYNTNESNPNQMSIEMLKQILEIQPRIYPTISKGLQQEEKFFGVNQDKPEDIPINEEQEENLSANRELLCPISQCVMENPVITKCGHSFDSQSITDWLNKGRNDCPHCKKAISKQELVPNFFIRSLINKLSVGIN